MSSGLRRTSSCPKGMSCRPITMDHLDGLKPCNNASIRSNKSLDYQELDFKSENAWKPLQIINQQEIALLLAQISRILMNNCPSDAESTQNCPTTQNPSKHRNNGKSIKQTVQTYNYCMLAIKMPSK